MIRLLDESDKSALETKIENLEVQIENQVDKLNKDLGNLTDKKVISKNLFNPDDSDIVIGKFINSDGTTFTNNSAYNTSGYIDVSNISQFVASSKRGVEQVGANLRSVAYFDENKNPISGGQESASLTENQTVVSGAKYMRVGYSNTAVEYQIENGYVKTSYESYKVNTFARCDNSVNKKHIKWIFGTLDTSNGGFVESNKKIVTDGIITFEKGDKFEIDIENTNAIVCIFNVDGIYKNQYLQMNNIGNSVIEFTETTYARIRICYNDNRIISNFENLLMYCKFTNTTKKSKWNGKKALMFGMSITFGYQLFDANWTDDLATSIPSNYCYMKEVCSRLGMTLTNMSCPGGTLAERSTSIDRNPLVNRWNECDTTYDLILIDCTTNDFQYSWTPFGEFEEIGNTHSKNTFIGAMQIVCEGLINKYPDAKIIWLTPLKRYQTGLYGRKANTIGKTLEDYSNAIKNICSYYGLETIDINAECNINPMLEAHRRYFNEEIETSGNFYTHLNLYGHNRVADYVESKLVN